MALSSKETEAARFVFSIYDFDSNGMDAFYLGPALRALKLAPTLSTISKFGGTQRKGQASFNSEEFIALYAKVKESVESGTMEDFLECLKINDKHESGTISTSHLTHLLQSYGEKLSDDEVDEIIRDCGNPQNGVIEYVPFLENLLSESEQISPVEEVGKLNTSSVINEGCTGDVKPTDKVKLKIQTQRPVPDEVNNPEPQTPKLSDAAFSLKTTKSKTTSISDMENAKKAATAAAEAVLKPKNQMPLIKIKTQGLIGNMVKK